MTNESASNAQLLALAQQTNDYTNRLGAAAAGIAADLNDLKAAIANGTVTPEALAQLDGAVANLNTMATSLEAIDAGYPVPAPTPTPEPTDPTEVPPAEEAPGTNPVG